MGALRGVNLGGWLLSEKWMTPSLYNGFDVKDEYTLSQTEAGKQRLRKHHRTFITEADFRWLRDHGVQLVRLPVGYGMFGDEPPYVGTQAAVDWAFSMASKYDLKILLDLHGVKGSQNGSDNSGKHGEAQWYRVRAYREQTLLTLERIAQRYGHHPALWGLELVNEPVNWRVLTLLWFHRQAERQVRPLLGEGVQIVFSDGYLPRLTSGTLRGRAVMDSHLYQCFLPWDRTRHPRAQLIKARARHRLLTWLRWRQPVIVGEWSRVLSEQTLRQIPDDEREAAKLEYTAAQLAAYDRALAWCYWSYKTESPDDWNFRYLVESGALPLDSV